MMQTGITPTAFSTAIWILRATAGSSFTFRFEFRLLKPLEREAVFLHFTLLYYTYSLYSCYTMSKASLGLPISKSQKKGDRTVELQTTPKYTVNGKEIESYKKRNTHTIVSAVAFLLGLQERFFENDEGFQKSIYNRLREDVRARIIRNLCMIRTAIIRNFLSIHQKITFEYKGLASMPEYIPPECIAELTQDNIVLPYHQQSLQQIIIEINKIISDRVNNCKEIFPLWLKWNYVKDIFIMKDGLTETGVRENRTRFYENKDCYPYRMYMNWNPVDEGNILYNDEKFVRLLYSWNGDSFTDSSKVQDAGSRTKGNIYQFLSDSEKAALVVDCENSDPYKLCATLQGLEPDMLQKVAKIILYDDIHSSSAWDILEEYIKVPVEYILIERVKQNKSLVDIRLTAGTCREFYQNNVDAFILVSSDSDYWGLISALPEANFLVMAEYEKCSPDIRAALQENGVYYCYIDDFYSGNCEDIKITALIREANRRLSQSVRVNVNELLDAALQATRIELDADEKRRTLNQYFKSLHMELSPGGDLVLRLSRKMKAAPFTA